MSQLTLDGAYVQGPVHDKAWELKRAGAARIFERPEFPLGGMVELVAVLTYPTHEAALWIRSAEDFEEVASYEGVRWYSVPRSALPKEIYRA